MPQSLRPVLASQAQIFNPRPQIIDPKQHPKARLHTLRLGRARELASHTHACIDYADIYPKVFVAVYPMYVLQVLIINRSLHFIFHYPKITPK